MTTSNINTPLMISDNGSNWTSTGKFASFDMLPFDSSDFDSLSIDAPLDQLYSVIYNNGTYVAVGNDILTSNDGGSWNQVYSQQYEYYFKIHCVIYANIGSFAGYVALSFGTDISNRNDLSVYSNIITSVNGSTWTRSSIPVSEYELNAIAAGNNLVVACGNNGSLYYSTNLLNWQVVTSNTTANLLSVTYYNGVYIAVGENGVMLYSTTGIDWDQLPSITNERLNKVAHCGIYFIAVGDNATILVSENGGSWRMLSNIIGHDSFFYQVQGDKFLTGYGPEELVPGVIYDNLSMRIKTSPSSAWDAQTFQHTGFLMKSILTTPITISNIEYATLVTLPNYNLLSDTQDVLLTEKTDPLILETTANSSNTTTNTRNVISFANIVNNPIQVAVYIVNSSTLTGRRIYEGIDYSIDNGWIPKIITVETDLLDNELYMVEVYEVGGGNQLAKSNTTQMPLLTNSDKNSTWTEINLEYDYQDTVYTTPICYHNGKKLEYNTDYFLKSSNTGQTHLVFDKIYDNRFDYISFAILGNTITSSNPTQFGYSVPETQVFVYGTPSVIDNDNTYITYNATNRFTLTNNFGGNNNLNSIVELNGLRLIYGTNYSIAGNILTVSVSLTNQDVIAVTSYNDTAQQYLNTQKVITFKVVPIVYIDFETSPGSPIEITTKVDSGFTTGDKVRIDGLNGADQLNDNVYYVKVNSPTSLELFLDASRKLPVTANFINPYRNSGYIWKDSTTLTISQPFALTDPTRFFVYVNGKRLDPKQLRLNSGNKLSVLTAIDTADVTLITSMVSDPSPNEMAYILNVDRTGIATVYRSNNNSKTWLTAPLYQTDTELFVDDITKIVETTSVKAIAENDGTSTYVLLDKDIELIKNVEIYNQTTFTSLLDSDFDLGYKNHQTTIIFRDHVSETDKLIITLYLGNEIEINGERMQFRKVDMPNNRVYQLMRGIKGTSKQKLIEVNTSVYSMLSTHILSNYYYNRTWNSKYYDSVNGDPLQISNTIPAKFLKIGS